MNKSTSFYRIMNQSIKPTDNASYIEKTNMLMDSVLKTKSTMKTILVLGTGNMHDMSLVFFMRNFKQVTLSDIDIESVKEQIKDKYNNRHVHLQEIDYLGLEQIAFFEELTKDLLLAKTSEKIQGIVNDKMKELLTYQFSSEFQEQFDSIYVSPIYTQLLYRQAESIIYSLSKVGFKKEFQEIALSSLLQNMILVIDHFNREIYKLLKKNGIAFIASDIFNLKDGDDFSHRVKNSIASNDVMEEIYHNYHDTYGFGLGDYGLHSISKMLKVLRSKWVIWNQSEHQAYAVKFRAFEKIDE